MLLDTLSRQNMQSGECWKYEAIFEKSGTRGTMTKRPSKHFTQLNSAVAWRITRSQQISELKTPTPFILLAYGTSF